MLTVTIKDGQYRGRVVEGTFNTDGDKAWTSGGKKRVRAEINGKMVGVIVDGGEYHFGNEAPAVEVSAETEAEMTSRIAKRFSVMKKMANGSIAGVVKSLIISGAAGVGKTFELEKRLEAAESAKKINYEKVAGKCSAIGLYMKLWDCRSNNAILLLDDVDVFSNEDALNILKAALDTGERRIVSWNTASTFLEEQGIPTVFEFEGTVIFISNTDFDREIERNTKLSPHMDALLSRSIYLDLGVHSKREIMIRVKEVVRNTTMLTEKGLNNRQIEDMMEWVEDNVDGLRNLSLRTMLHIGDMVLTDPTDWIDMAEVTMLKPVRRRRV